MAYSKALLSLFVLAVIYVEGSAAIACYIRSGTLTYNNGTAFASCGSSDTTCYTYTYTAAQYSGCGACPVGTANAYGCTTCTGDYCNVQSSSVISCFTINGFASGISGISNSICYGMSKCYRFSTTYGGSTAWFGGCGGCNSYYPNCKDCSTDYCNNHSNLVASGSVKMAIAGVLLMALVKLGL